MNRARGLIRWVGMLSAALLPFLAGGMMMFDLVFRKWLFFWFWVGLSLVYAVATIRLDIQRAKTMRAVQEMRAKEARGMLDQSGEMIQRLLVDNVRAYAILAALVGIKMSVSIKVKKAKQ